ncbi:MAG: PEGA domain-containing protein, partial [Polyangia bacterium]
ALSLALAGGGAVFFGLRHRRVQTIAPPPRMAPAPVPAVPLPQEAPIAVGPIVVRPTPPPHPHQRGLLSINAIPWANLFVDGRAVGHTPRRKLVLEAGKHQLRLVTQAGESRSRTVEIAPNRETTLTVVFSEP